MGLIFMKYQALGNDYLVYDCLENTHELTVNEIKRVCDRHFGIGSDGVLVGPVINSEDAGVMGVRIFNPDGSEAEKSGNGLRIFSKYIRDAGYPKALKDNIMLQTMGGMVRVSYLNRSGTRTKVFMGKLNFDSRAIGVKGKVREVVAENFIFGDTAYTCTAVSIGNPHLVIPMKNISRKIVEEIGSFSERADYFINGINTQIMKVDDKNNIHIEIFERGAGYTYASGSSACATAGAAKKLGLADSNINVHMPGGVLGIEIHDDWTVEMTGRAEFVGKFEYFNNIK